jgi:hypothetical protein
MRSAGGRGTRLRRQDRSDPPSSKYHRRHSGPTTARLRNKVFDSRQLRVAARHSGQGRRPRPGIQEQKMDSRLRGNDGRDVLSVPARLFLVLSSST